MLTFTVFDVGHGFCAYASTPPDDILFDCGYDNELLFYPSQYFVDRRITTISRLVLSHFDQDHVSNLPDLREKVEVRSITRNPTVPASLVERQKQEGGTLTRAVESALEMHRWTAPVTTPYNHDGAELKTFYNSYPRFQDLNNLSLVAFLFYSDLGIVIPGDIERAGWDALLEDEEFRNCLRRTTVFIASHHGRENGYCEGVFEFCRPQLIILSDKNISFDSQEHDYSRHASGVSWGNGQIRRVLTTRCDGHIKIEKRPGQTGIVSAGFEL